MIKSIIYNKNHWLDDTHKEPRKATKSNDESLHKILFVGVNGVSASQHFANKNCLCVTLFSGKQAFEWLEQQVLFFKELELELPIVAVICDIEWLKEDDFYLLKKINAHKKLQKIPIIAIKEKKCTEAERINWLKKGIDDCYVIPINWQKLYKRIVFLQEMKAIQYKMTVTQKSIFTENGLQLPRSKRILDVIVAGTSLFFLSPLFLLIALLIKLESKGKVIYASKRAGKAYRVFDFYKFRTMYANADKRLSDLQHLNQYTFSDKERPNTFVKLQDDPRITRFGRFLRMTSLDELPQLVNVLKGDMSLVGNRPLPLYEAQEMTRDHWAARFLAPAGITGLWQVSKRAKKDMSIKERINLDIEYAQNYSFWKDLKILFQTIPAMIQKETR